MSVKLLTEHRYEFLSLNGGCTDLSESTLVKIPHCWKTYVAAHISKKICNKLLIIYYRIFSAIEERSGSVVGCWTQNREFVGPSLTTRDTALIQPWKTHPNMP